MTKETETLINSIEDLQNISMRQFHAIGDLIEQVKNSVVLADVISRLKKIDTYDLTPQMNDYNAQTPELYIQEEKTGNNGDWIKTIDLENAINGL